MSITSFTAPDGRLGYRIRSNIGRDRSGRYLTKCRTTYGTARQAQEIENQMKAAAERAKNCRTEAEIYEKMRSVMVNASPVPLKKALEKAVAKPASRITSNVRAKAKRGYWMDFVGWMAEFAPLINNMQDVTEIHAENYIAFLRKNGAYCKFKKEKMPTKLSNDTLNAYQQSIRQVFELLRKETGMHSNPFGDIPFLPARHAEREAYTEDQLNTIFLKADTYLRPLFFIGLFTGLSEGDICTLQKDEINFPHHHIYRKRSKTRNTSGKISAIPMLPVLEDFLKDSVDNPENKGIFVLPRQAEDYLRDRSSVSKKVKTFLEIDCEFDTCRKIDGRSRAQSILDFHSLRHTFCSIAGTVGIPLTVVKNIVGHMSPHMTELYSRHVEEQDRLRWIRLFGERLKSLPNLPVARIETDAEPERAAAVEAIRTADIETVRKILAMLQTQA